MAGLTYNKEEIENLIGKIVQRTMRMDLTWDWPCGVAYYGISSAFEATGNKDYLNQMKDMMLYKSLKIRVKRS